MKICEKLPLVNERRTLDSCIGSWRDSLVVSRFYRFSAHLQVPLFVIAIEKVQKWPRIFDLQISKK